MIQDGLREAKFPITSFLLAGQSNMAGRGEFADVEPIQNPDCYMLRMGRWQPMREPINPDRAIFEGLYHSGVGLSASFADEYAKYFQAKIGLIPCADGGTMIEQWMPGEVLFDHAVMMTKLAMRNSEFGGILWHQGESNCKTDESVEAYHDQFCTMIGEMRRQLGAEQLPVIIGELSETIQGHGVEVKRLKRMNEVFREIAADIPYCAVVSAKGLEMKPDGIHFNSVSYREFGRRYFAALREVLGK